MGQAGYGMSFMVGWSAGQNIFFFALPIGFSIYIAIKHHINLLDKKFMGIVLLFAVWQIGICLKYSTLNVSYAFFTIYPLFVAYIMIKAYGKYLFIFYEDIITKLSIISLFGWLILLIIPKVVNLLGASPEESVNFYVFNIQAAKIWLTPIRNSGFSWEPGRFASLVVVAILFNLYRTNFSVKSSNKNFYILLIALITTFSTTGYMSFFLGILPLFLNKYRKYAVPLFLVFCSIAIYLYNSVDFLGEKIESLSDISTTETRLEEASQYIEEAIVPQRIDAAYLEALNIINDPILGYGKDVLNSHINKDFAANIFLPNGHLKVFARYGILLGALIFLWLFRASKRIAKTFNNKRTYGFLIIMILICMSYEWFGIPYITAFWLYGYFAPPKTQFA